MNRVRVFADFHNADVKGRVRLNCAGTVADFERQPIIQDISSMMEKKMGKRCRHYRDGNAYHVGQFSILQ